MGPRPIKEYCVPTSLFLSDLLGCPMNEFLNSLIFIRFGYFLKKRFDFENKLKRSRMLSCCI